MDKPGQLGLQGFQWRELGSVVTGNDPLDVRPRR
jgi:hypothetical protein